MGIRLLKLDAETARQFFECEALSNTSLNRKHTTVLSQFIFKMGEKDTLFLKGLKGRWGILHTFKEAVRPNKAGPRQQEITLQEKFSV